jgi:oxygen-independent coproporphyrinogen-3 oxidase
MSSSDQLTAKYNVAAPRYTSYPTVPYWDTAQFTVAGWKHSVKTSFDETNQQEGISIYIHLPFCESLCTYCGCNTRITKNHLVEEPYIKAVLKEWQMYCDMMDDRPVIRELHLGGGTPTFFAAENLRHLIEGILDKAIIHEKAEFGFEAHPGNTTAEHLQVLFDLGFRRLSLGIQDFDPKVQFIINRQQTLEQVLTVTTQARDIGYTSVNYDLIYGLPLQTMDGLCNTMEIVSGLRPDRIAFYSYAHVPWIKPGQRRFTEADLPSPELKDALNKAGRNLLFSYGYFEIGMDHFALPGDALLEAERTGKLHRNFMGYTGQHTQLLIGLGVSAISDSWYGFAQNVKTVEAYLQRLDHDELAVTKGHLLTNEDLILRRHILNMMCKGVTDWTTTEHYCRELFEGIERLLPLAKDGLVNLSPFKIEVTPVGKRYLRNICMALDARLWANQPESQLFSMAV